MNLVCLYYKMAFKPQMKAGWFTKDLVFLVSQVPDEILLPSTLCRGDSVFLLTLFIQRGMLM